jgi:hypothetical protein
MPTVLARCPCGEVIEGYDFNETSRAWTAASDLCEACTAAADITPEDNVRYAHDLLGKPFGMSAQLCQDSRVPLQLAVPCAATLLAFGLGGGNNGLKDRVDTLANLLRSGVRDIPRTRDDRARYGSFNHLLLNYSVGCDAAALAAAALEAGQKARKQQGPVPTRETYQLAL